MGREAILSLARAALEAVSDGINQESDERGGRALRVAMAVALVISTISRRWMLQAEKAYAATDESICSSPGTRRSPNESIGTSDLEL